MGAGIFEAEVADTTYEFEGPGADMYAFTIWSLTNHGLWSTTGNMDVTATNYILGDFYDSDADAMGQDGCIDFASEAKALIEAGAASVDPDPAQLVRYLTFGYVPSPGSAFRGLERLEPGTMLVADENDIETHRYWELPEAASPVQTRDHDWWKKAIFEQLTRATRDRLRSDVPLGLFLSGGIDSGLVLAAARRVTNGPLNTFTIGFDDPRFDESELAARTARQFGTQHQCLRAHGDPAPAIDEVAAVFDEPFGDASAVPTLMVSRLAREHVTVVLSGDGGDETFAGYRRHQAVRAADGLSALLPPAGARFLSRVLGEMANGTAGRGAVGQLRRFCTALGLPAELRSLYWSTFFRAPLRKRFLSPDLLDAAGGVDPEAETLRRLTKASAAGAQSGSRLQRVLREDQRSYLPDDLLVKVDLASMSCGLEVRCPWLDHRLVEQAAGLPDELLNSWHGRRQTKIVLRELARDLLPRQVAQAPKRGFGVPLAAWFSGGPLQRIGQERLLSQRFAARGILRAGAAQHLWSRHQSGREDWSAFLWILLALDASVEAIETARTRQDA